MISLVLVLVLPVFVEQKGKDKPAAPPILVRDLADNVRARLTGVKSSERRGRALMARFETLGKDPKQRIVTFPNHSFTTHEATLRAVIMSGVDLDRVGDDGWHPVRLQVIASLPPENAPHRPGRYSQLDTIFLYAVEPLKDKK
jgi:hypothetical protein